MKIDVQIYESGDSGSSKKASAPYMPTDKAKFLVSKKPELGELVKDLDLDVK